jgi:hypothetical protein
MHSGDRKVFMIEQRHFHHLDSQLQDSHPYPNQTSQSDIWTSCQSKRNVLISSIVNNKKKERSTCLCDLTAKHNCVLTYNIF